MTEDESKVAAEDLAKRLRLLLDVAITESGSEPTYAQIAAFLEKRGINLSRSRWTYMVNGHRYVQDPALFEGLAAFFDVDAAFLLGEDGRSDPGQGHRAAGSCAGDASSEGEVLRRAHAGRHLPEGSSGDQQIPG